MKRSARLVNTSRGPIVVEAALIAALKAGQIAGAAIDVYDVEPLPADHPYRNLDNLLATPHIGYVSRGSVRTLLPRHGFKHHCVAGREAVSSVMARSRRWWMRSAINGPT